MRYRSNLPNEARLELSSFRVPQEEFAILAAQLGEDFKLVVRPGEEFDSPGPLNHPLLEPLDAEAKAHAAQVLEQDAEHARAYHLAYGPSENRETPEFPQIPQPPVPPGPGEPGFQAKKAKE